MRASELEVGHDAALGLAGRPDAPTSSKEPRRARIEIGREPVPSHLACLDIGPVDRAADVIFLHANGFNADAYREGLAPLSGSLAIRAIDQRGHGLTDLATPTEGRTNYDDLRDDLVALFDADPGGSPILVGHSLGATVAVLAAAQRPAYCRRLILVEPVMAPSSIRHGLDGRSLPGTRRAGEILAKTTLRRRAVFPDRQTAFEQYKGRGAFAKLSDQTIVDFLRTGVRDRDDGQVELSCSPVWEASNYGAYDFNPLFALTRLNVPVWIIRSELGSMCRIGSGSALRRMMPNVAVATVAGSGHMLALEHPELLRKLIDAGAWGLRLDQALP